MWSDKYRPKSLSDVAGNTDAVRDLREWSDNWTEGSPAVILYGPPGVGKTSSAYALAKEKNWDVVEMNASDKRTKDVVNEIAGISSQTESLTQASQKLVIIDEADNLHGHSDRGGKKAMTKLVDDTKQPILLIANDFYDLSRSLRNKTKNIEFDRVDDGDIARTLKTIADEEDIGYSIDEIKSIAKNAGGDVRGAINDLQKSSSGGEINEGTGSASRDKSQEIFPFLDSLLKEEQPRTVRNKSQQLDLTPYDLYQWVSRNIYYEYDRDELLRGIDELANASRLLGIVNKTQNYRFWRYTTDSLTSGVSLAREGNHSGWTRWQPPKYRTGTSYDKDVVQSILDSDSNVSRGTARTEIYPYISKMIEYCKPEELASEFVAWYAWDKKDLSSVSGSGKSTNKVERVVNKGEDIQSDFTIESGNRFSVEEDEDQSSEDTDDDQSGLKDFM